MDKPRTYVCEHCPKRFEDLFSLEKHSLKHTGIFCFDCPLGSWHPDARSLETHRTEKHGPYRCLYCNTKVPHFDTEAALATHMTKEHKKHGVTCLFCNRGYKLTEFIGHDCLARFQTVVTCDPTEADRVILETVYGPEGTLALSPDGAAVGIDLEHKPHHGHGQPRLPAGLIQLALRKDLVLLFHLCQLMHQPPTDPSRWFPPALLRLLQDTSITKVLCGRHDVLAIAEFCPETMLINPVADLQEIVCVGSTKVGLAELARRHLEVELPKGVGVRCSDWSLCPLAYCQRAYAAIDAWATLLVFIDITTKGTAENGPEN
eukprot:TRINITY_DN3376_c0_g1_i1.p1 TRINITY_DN3376_c0_g1~~TRINITY_DN3376_c0_g1_i1.p1  ORF type:complete len:318 (-),score=28.85 TRINITY_DN3376_c0_g1_i1:131-1084(-)